MDAAVAVLHATTIIDAFLESRKSVIATDLLQTISAGFGP
jgi:hypothetical protein